jgi:hypothetical protein
MASHNQYRGYVKLPKKKLYLENISLDFNGHIDSNPGGTKLEGFSLRLFALGNTIKDDQPEISVTLRPEEWLDLIDAMKEEFESVSKAREDFDKLR